MEYFLYTYIEFNHFNIYQKYFFNIWLILGNYDQPFIVWSIAVIKNLLHDDCMIQ